MSQLVSEGIVEPKSVQQLACYEAGLIFARTEGIIPAPETTHALACAIDEAKKAKEEGREKVILVNYSGHGLLDLSAYDKYFSGSMTNFVLADETIEASEAIFKDYPKPQLLKSR